MAHLIDTAIAVYMRDRQPEILDAVRQLDARPFLSIISRVELEGGVYAKAALAEKRRQAVDTLLGSLTVLPFDEETARIYGRIVEAIGFSRLKIVDRMIASTALAYDLMLITTNGDDFADVPGLKLEIWPSP